MEDFVAALDEGQTAAEGAKAFNHHCLIVTDTFPLVRAHRGEGEKQTVMTAEEVVKGDIPPRFPDDPVGIGSGKAIGVGETPIPHPGQFTAFAWLIV